MYCYVLCLVSDRVVSLWLCWVDTSTSWQVVLSAVSGLNETTWTQVMHAPYYSTAYVVVLGIVILHHNIYCDVMVPLVLEGP